MNSRHSRPGPPSQAVIPDDATLNLLPVPCWKGDAAGRCTFVNRAWLFLTGRQDRLETIHPDDREATAAVLESACRLGATFELEYRFRHADGTYRWVSDQGHPMRDPKGEVQGYLAYSFDVHQRRTSEAKCLRLVQLYQAIGRMNQALTQNASPIALFEEACRVVVEEGPFQLAWVGLVDRQTRIMTAAAAAGILPDLDSGNILSRLREGAFSVGPDSGQAKDIVSRACQDGHFVMSDDLEDQDGLTPWSSLAREHGLRASAAFPLLVRGQVRGVLVLSSEEPGAFDSDLVDLLDRVAEKIGWSLEQSDQTKRRLEIEGRLRASERLFAATLDTMNAAIAVLDEQGRILAVNVAWSDFQDAGNPLVYGHGPGFDYRAACSEFMSDEGNLGAAALGSLEVMDGSREVFVADYLGQGESALRWYATTVSRFSNEGLPRVVLAHREITKHKLADERLRSSETLFRAIAESAVDLIAVMDTTGRRMYCSPSYTGSLGYSLAELEAQVALEIVHPEERERVRRTFQMIGGGVLQSIHTEYRVARKDGQWLKFDFHLTAIPDPLGGPTRILVLGRDITEREAAEQERQRMEVQLRHSQKLQSIGQLAAGIAHEINTPTQYIGDNLRFMQEGITDLLKTVDKLMPLMPEAMDKAEIDYLRGELPKAAHQSLEGVARVSKIVGAMKEFSHPGGEEKTLADLNRAIESTVTVSRNEWKYVAELTLDLDPDLPPVPCLPSEINQVVLNLVVNAAHAIADQVGNSGQLGRITVSTRHEGGEAVILVEDSGAGIPEAIRSRIFDPFFTTKEVGRGSGQGLAIAHTVVVDKHGGSISFETEDGAGTVFTIRLPLQHTPKGPA
jgi:PAS domain S-box-containing protein